MIGTVIRAGWLQFLRDRPSLLLSYALPVVFFSVFALVFGSQLRGGTPKVAVALVDEDRSEASRRLVDALTREPGLRVRTEAAPREGAAPVPLTRESAEALVRKGSVPVAIVLPKGLGDHFPSFGGDGPPVSILADSSDPIAPQIVNGLLQKLAMTSAPDLLARNGIGQFERYAGALTAEQRTAVDRWIPELEQSIRGTQGAGGGPGEAPSSGSALSEGLVPVKIVDVLGETKKAPLVALYAAGTAVMFLLFTCSSAGGALLDEAESGTLDRLLSTSLGMGRLLLGKWVFLTLLGVSQLFLMFVWGAVAFGVELWSHLGGFTLVTTVTAGAASAFGLVLASACRTRRQLGGLSTALILVMSAVGGSMFPRFFMSESLKKLGYVTFNAWALDGYIKVFWRETPLVDLWPQLLVLSSLTVAFLVAARYLARRWETL